MLKNPLKKIFLLALLGLAFFTHPRGLAKSLFLTSTLSENCSLPVLAADYCTFLNHVATTSDPDHLYDQKMSTDPETACIRRSRVAGSYHYEVIAGRENLPITFVNRNDAEAYSCWLGNGAIISCIPENEENTLHASRFTLHSTFIEDGSCEPSLTLAATSPKPFSSSKWSREDFLAIVPFIAAGMLGEKLGTIQKRSAEAREDQVVAHDQAAADDQHLEVNNFMTSAALEAANARVSELRQQEASRVMAVEAKKEKLKDQYQRDLAQLNSNKKIAAQRSRADRAHQDAMAAVMNSSASMAQPHLSQVVAEDTTASTLYYVALSQQEVDLETRFHQELEAIARKDQKDRAAFESSIADAERIVGLAKSEAGKNRKMTPAEQEFEDAQSVARNLHKRALSLDAIAQAAKAKAYENNFEKESAAYKAAEEIWMAVAEAAQTTLAKAEIASFTASELQPLRASLHEAQVQQMLWEAHNFWINARRIEQAIATAPGDLTREEALRAETAWAEAAYWSKRVLEKATIVNKDELIVDATKAEAAETFWKARAEALKPSEARVNRETKASLVKKLTKSQQQADTAARNAIWSENNQQVYEQWELPEDIFEKKNDDALEERSSDEVKPPLMLDEEAEELGRKLLRDVERNGQMHSVQIVMSTAAPAPATEQYQQLDPFDQIKQLSSQLNDLNKRRWAARVEADRLHEQAAEAVKMEQAEAEAMVAENARATEFDDSSSVWGRACSVFSTTPWRPKLSAIPSEAGSRTGTAFSRASKISTSSRSSTDLGKAADEAEAAWLALAQEAERARIDAGGVVIAENEVQRAWKKADKKAVASEQERERIKREQAIAATLREEWALNTTRWKARAEADLKATAAKNLAEEARRLEQEMRLLNANVSATEAAKERAYQEFHDIKPTLQAAERVAAEAINQWNVLADQHPSIIKAGLQDETALLAARKKIEESDRAVNDLWAEVKKLYDPEEFVEPSDPEGERLKICEDKEKYREECLAHGRNIEPYFKEAEEALDRAKTKYTDKSPKAQAEAQQLFNEVNRLDQEAIKIYTEASKNKALEAARKKILGAEEAWVCRKIEANNRCKNEEAIARASRSADRWADDAVRNFVRATGIAKANKKAFMLFEKETERLKDIETLWIGIIEAKQKEPMRRAERAARAYMSGDESAWNALHASERTAYNEAVKAANSSYTVKYAANLKMAEARVKEAMSNAYKINTSLLTSAASRQASMEAAEKAENELMKIIKDDVERTLFVGWHQCSAKERVAADFSQMVIYKVEKLQKERWSLLSVDQQIAELHFKLTQAKLAKAKYKSNAVTAREERKTDDVTNWENAADGLIQASKCLTNAIEVLAVGTKEKLEEGEVWKEAARESQRYVEYQLKALELRATGKIDEAKRWTDEKEYSFSFITRIIELQTKGYKIVIKQLKSRLDRFSMKLDSCIEYSLKEIEARAVGRIEEASQWERAVTESQGSSEFHLKAIEARKEGKLEEASQWESAAAESQRSSEFHLKAIEARKAGKNEDAKSSDNAGVGAHFSSERLAEAIEARPIPKNEDENITARLAKAIEAWIARGMEEASQWERAAAESQRQVEFCLKAIEARAAGKPENAKSWDNAAVGACSSSLCLAKAIEARTPEKVLRRIEVRSTREMARLINSRRASDISARDIERSTTVNREKLEEASQWESVAAESQREVEYFLKAIDARAAGKSEDAKSYDNAGAAARCSSDHFAKAIEARKEGKLEEASQWESAARESQRQSEFSLKAIDARAAGRNEDAQSSDNAGVGAFSSSDCLAKAIEARKEGKFEEASQWESAAGESQRSIEFNLKAIEARAAGKSEDAAEWKKAAAESQRAVEYFRKAIEARAAGKNEDATSYDAVGHNASWSSNRLAKAIEARKEGKFEEASQWESAVAESQRAVEYFLKEIDARAAGKPEETESWTNWLWCQLEDFITPSQNDQSVDHR